VEAASEIRRMACVAFDAISCEGLARVDFFYTPAGQVLVNEINTMPGMTPASGFPMMWAASGLPLPQLVDRIIQTALRKRPGLRLGVRLGPARRWPAGGCSAGGRSRKRPLRNNDRSRKRPLRNGRSRKRPRAASRVFPGCRPRPLWRPWVTSWASRR